MMYVKIEIIFYNKIKFSTQNTFTNHSYQSINLNLSSYYSIFFFFTIARSLSFGHRRIHGREYRSFIHCTKLTIPGIADSWNDGSFRTQKFVHSAKMNCYSRMRLKQLLDSSSSSNGSKHNDLFCSPSLKKGNYSDNCV
mmetsp:Transcript_8147/g.12177  ORF Transcript_8147/g.12177 Transcript_8147/m.12177 type:complete len:139 (-) Transcript_8147:436-852(-)